MLKNISFFSQHRCNIIAYDHRGHGLSYGARPSFGWFEKHDLRRVVDFARQRFPGTEKLVLFGESMGAATVLQYAPSDSRLAAIILDSPFSSFRKLVLAQLSHIPCPLR
jgi:alpha-beta hydrolase superfamily lysophospholipase